MVLCCSHNKDSNEIERFENLWPACVNDLTDTIYKKKILLIAPASDLMTVY